MARNFEPSLPFDTPALLLKMQTEKINGVNQPTYTEAHQFFCSAKSYGGTEKQVNGVTVIEDTWTVDAYYDPAFDAGDKIRFLDDNTEFKILARPENINRKGLYMRFKVTRVGG